MSQKPVARFEFLGISYPIYDGMNIIGRDLEASIIIKNLKVSKKHAIISVIGDKHYISDFNSSNGCSLKDETLVPLKFYEIYNQDNITLGDIIGTYYYDTNFTANSQDVKFLKPKIPKHISFAPTQQICSIDVPKISITQDDTHLAPTQLLINDENQSSVINITNSKSSKNIFSLIKANKNNDSREIVLCDDSLNDNYNDSFAKVALDSSTEIPCTQECFSAPKRDSFNDSTVIPATQDVSCDTIHQKSSNLKKSNEIKDTEDCDTQIDEYDTDATDSEIEKEQNEDDIFISIKKLTPEPFENKDNMLENNLSKNDVFSDDDEIDFCPTNLHDRSLDIQANTTDTSLKKDIDISKTSSCVNDLDENITEDVSQTTTKCKDSNQINENNESDSIPEAEEYNLNDANRSNNEIISDTQENLENKKIIDNLSKYKDVDFTAPTQILSNEMKKSFIDVDFDAPTQILNLENVDDQYLAPTQLLDTSLENDVKDFNMPRSRRKKKNNQNESIKEEDDINFLASTQTMMDSFVNSESDNLDYYSSQEIDGIPEITFYQDNIVKGNEDVFLAPTQILDNKTEQDHELKQHNKTIDYHDVDFSAPTQILNKNNIDKDDGYFLAPTQALIPTKANNKEDDIFLAPTQELKKSINKNTSISDKENINVINKTTIQTSTSNSQLARAGDDDIFLAPTQELMNNAKNPLTGKGNINITKKTITQTSTSNSQLARVVDDDIFLAPTQELMNNAKNTSTGKGNINVTKKTITHTSTNNSQLARAVDDDIFLAPTQELINNAKNTSTGKGNINVSRKTITETSTSNSQLARAVDDDIFLAPTQELMNNAKNTSTGEGNINDTKKTITQTSICNSQLARAVDDDIFLAPTQELMSNAKNAPTGKGNINITKKTITQTTKSNSQLGRVVDDDIFLAPTQELMNIAKNTSTLKRNINVVNKTVTQTSTSNSQLARAVDDDIFLAPTQELMNKDKNISTEKGYINVINETTIQTSTSNSQLTRVVDDIFLAPTQEIMDKHISLTNIIIDDEDSDDSDIEIKKKRPKIIKETQEEIVIEDSDSDSEIGYIHKKPLCIVETQQINESQKVIHENQDNKEILIKSCGNDSAVLNSQLEDTLESIRLCISDTSMNDTNTHLNTSNKEDNTQLEINLPTEKEYFVSQNTRPSNPLVQVLSSEETQITNETQEHNTALHTYNLLYPLEPTQVIDDDINISVDIPESVPEDYGEICEMETQPIGGITHVPSPKNNIKKDSKKVEKRKNENYLASKTRSKKIIEDNDANVSAEPTRTTRSRPNKNIKTDNAPVSERKSAKTVSSSKKTSVEEIPLGGKRKADTVKQKDVKTKKLTKNKRDLSPDDISSENKQNETSSAISVEKELPMTKEKRKTVSFVLDCTAAKRSTRAKSVSKEEKEHVDAKKTRRKTLATITEDKLSKAVVSLTPIEFKIMGKDLNKKEIKNVDEVRLKEKTKQTKAIKGLKTNEKSTDKNVPSTSKNIVTKKITDEKETKTNQKQSKKSTRNLRSNIKTITDSLSTDYEDKPSPSKKLKPNSQESVEFDSLPSSCSITRRETKLRYKVVFTMLDDTNLEATITRLGGTIVNSSQECTVLCTSKISRSLKFLVAVSLGKPIVGPEWVRACGHAHKFLDPWDYILKDPETEKKNNFILRNAIIKGSHTKMFEGYTCMLLVNKNLDVLKNAIEACGGNCITRMPVKTVDGNFIIVSYPEDKNKYGKYLKQIPPVKVVGAEAIIAGALKQKMLLDEHILT